MLFAKYFENAHGSSSFSVGRRPATVALALYALFCVISLSFELYILTDIRDNKAKIRYDVRDKQDWRTEDDADDTPDKKLFGCTVFADVAFIDTAVGENHFLFFAGDESVSTAGSDENLEYRRRMELAEFYSKNREEYSRIATPVEPSFYRGVRNYCVSELSWGSRILSLLLDIGQHTSLLIVCVMVVRLLVRRDIRLLRNSGRNPGAIAARPSLLLALDNADKELLENPAPIIIKAVIFCIVFDSGSRILYPHPATRVFCNPSFHISSLLLLFLLRKRFYRYIFVDDYKSWHMAVTRIAYPFIYWFALSYVWFGYMAIDDGSTSFTYKTVSQLSVPSALIGIGVLVGGSYVEKRNDRRLILRSSEGQLEQLPTPPGPGATTADLELPANTKSTNSQQKTQQVLRMRLCLIWVAILTCFCIAEHGYQGTLYSAEKAGRFPSSGRLIVWQLQMVGMAALFNKVWGVGLGNSHEPNFRTLMIFPCMLFVNTYAALLLFRAGLNSGDFVLSLIIMLMWESFRDTYFWHLVGRIMGKKQAPKSSGKTQSSENEQPTVPELSAESWTSFSPPSSTSRLGGDSATWGPETWGSLPREVSDYYGIVWWNIQASFAETYAGVITCVLVLFEFTFAKLAGGSFEEVSFLLTREPDGSRHSVFAETELNSETYYKYTIPYGINNEGKPDVARYSDEEFFWSFSGLLLFVMLEHVQIALCREWNLKRFAKVLAESRVFEENIKDDSKKVTRLEFFEKLTRELFQVLTCSHFWLRLSIGVFIFLVFLKGAPVFASRVIYV